MPDRYQPLRDAIAAGPTKGKREVRDDHPSRACIRVGVEGVGDEIATLFWAPGDQERNVYGVWQDDHERKANAALFAATDPDTIAALLKERDALREAVRGLLDALPSATTHPAIKAARAALAKLEGDHA